MPARTATRLSCTERHGAHMRGSIAERNLMCAKPAIKALQSNIHSESISACIQVFLLAIRQSALLYFENFDCIYFLIFYFFHSFFLSFLDIIELVHLVFVMFFVQEKSLIYAMYVEKHSAIPPTCTNIAGVIERTKLGYFKNLEPLKQQKEIIVSFIFYLTKMNLMQQLLQHYRLW